MKDLLADVLLYAVLLAAGAIAGITYESSRQAQADKTELQELQRRAASNAAWLRGERVASENRLNQQIADLYTQLSTTQGQANEKHQTHVAGVRSGTVSVRVPIVPASCPSVGVGTSASATAAAPTTHAQLDPAAAADLAAIPHEGDAAIRELNTCIAQYNQVKQAQQDWLASLKNLEPPHAQTR